jgi:hypothetical protein
VETPHNAKDAPPAKNKQARRDEPAVQSVRLAQQQALQSEQAANAFRGEASAKRKGSLPVPMMLLGGLLVLVLIVGGSVAYLNFGKSSRPQTGTTQTGTPVAKSSPQAHITPTPVSIKSKLAGTGEMLYGTTIPGPGTNCDTQGGKWTSTSGANISCSANGMTLDNRLGSQPTAVFLQTMKNGPLPGSYVIQAQVTITSGNFGIFFLSQPDQNLKFAWILNPGNNTSQVNSYSNDMSSSPVTGPITVSQNKIGTTATIDVTVQGSQSHIYVNGSGYPYASPGGNNGILGLAADAGANITFKNVAIYAL